MKRCCVGLRRAFTLPKVYSRRTLIVVVVVLLLVAVLVVAIVVVASQLRHSWIRD